MPVKTKHSKKKQEKHYQPACHLCNGLCCRHIAMEIDRPTTKNDFDNIRWYLMHGNTRVGIDHDNNWMIEVATGCRHLQGDHRCGVYDHRPAVCRGYPGADSCEHEDKSSTYKLLFSNDDELVQWISKTRPSWKFGRNNL